jgi:hypothetical protein
VRDIFQCPKCELRFKTKSELEQHSVLDHASAEAGADVPRPVSHIGVPVTTPAKEAVSERQQVMSRQLRGREGSPLRHLIVRILQRLR